MAKKKGKKRYFLIVILAALIYGYIESGIKIDVVENAVDKVTDKYNEVINSITNSDNNDDYKDIDDINASGDYVKVHFIDVGQGDATFIEFGDFHILIDAGNNWYGDDVVEYLKQHNVDDIEILIGTHPDADHIGGLDVVMENFKVENIIDSCREHDTKTYIDYTDNIKKQVDNGATWVCPLNTKYTINEDVYFEIINTNVTSNDNNDHSVLTKLVAFNTSFLFTGDLEEQVESSLLDKAIDVDVYKVGHHGSDTSSSAEFLEKVTPKYAVISCGKDNKYGHPHDEAVLRIQEYTQDIYSTHLSGHVVITVNKDSVKVNTDLRVEADK